MSNKILYLIISALSILFLTFIIPSCNKDKEYINLLKADIVAKKVEFDKNLKDKEIEYNTLLAILNVKAQELKTAKENLLKEKETLKQNLTKSQNELASLKLKLSNIQVPISKEEASNILNNMGYKNSIRECL